MQTDTVSIEQFIADARISMTAQRVGRNPNMEPVSAGSMDHWKVTFSRIPYEKGSKEIGVGPRVLRAIKLTTYFSMGYGHNGKEPKAADVLDCLASDASSVDQEDFEEWCANMGWDSDSRKAERTYKACEHGAKRLKAFLGDDLYQTLLYGTERM